MTPEIETELLVRFLPLHIITIVLDGMPWIAWHYEEFKKLREPWTWWVLEGVAQPRKDTSWVAEVAPRLSVDGTTDWMKALAAQEPRVRYVAQPAWPGKTQMFNHALDRVQDPEFVLWQVDHDEIWTAEQIEAGREMLSAGPHNCAYFRCRYFVGPDIVITNREGFGNHGAYEWRRAWKVKSPAMFETHEPPVVAGFEPRPADRDATERLGLVFDHFAYATEAQVRWKETYYGSKNNANGWKYRNAVDGWRRLQAAPMPCQDVGAYLPWVGPGVRADRAMVG